MACPFRDGRLEADLVGGGDGGFIESMAQAPDRRDSRVAAHPAIEFHFEQNFAL